MDHLVAILAHKNQAHLEILVDQLLEMEMQVLIHVDSKSTIDINHPKLAPHCIEERIDVRRGHISIVDATIALMIASLDKKYNYFHLISGEDFVVKSKNAFRVNFEDNTYLYLNSFRLLDPDPYASHSQVSHKYNEFKDQLPQENYQYKFFKNGIGLVDTYHFQEDTLASKIIEFGKRFRIFTPLYHKLFSRKLPDIEFYGGSAWFSLTAPVIEFLVNYSERKPQLLTYLRNSLFPDEIYFHTILRNSEHDTNILNSDARYISWGNSGNNGPRMLNEDDLVSIQRSNGYFARKFDLANNPELLKQIEEELLC